MSPSSREPPVALRASSAVSAADGMSALCAESFVVGCAVGAVLPDGLTPQEQALLVGQFAALTPENCMKPVSIQPAPGRYDFAEPDALVAFAEQHGMAVNAHCLVWHQQTPDWSFSGDGVRERLVDHIRTVVGRYAGRVATWDVVNEAVAEPGEGLRESPWLAALGPEYLEIAFHAARAADPGAVLYYNDYNIERPAKRERTLRLLRGLLERGVPVQGVGIQGHWVLDQLPFADLEAAIEAYGGLGLEVSLTEVDLDVIDRPDCGADVAVHREYHLDQDLYAEGCPPEILARQAEQYGRLVRILADHADTVARLSFWGLHDGVSWLNDWPGKRTNHPLLFDRACRAKPAMDAIARALQR